MEAASDRSADLRSQLEALLHAVWLCERQWTLDDRFDLLLGNPPPGTRQ